MQTRYVCATEKVFSFSGGVQQSHNRQQCGFSTPRWAANGNIFTLIDGEMNIVQRRGFHILGVEDLLDALQTDEVLSSHWLAPTKMNLKGCYS